jgi:EAL domain-containing protein (putative c-di-GMP-specific phosphodiesterase class I)
VGNSSLDTAHTADKILCELSLPHSIDGSELNVTTSIGISIYPEDGNDTETLIKNADTAMYHAKESGRNNYQFFRNDMNTRAMERMLIETNLRHALDKQEFSLLFQPKINLNSGQITGVEVLLRWNQSELGEISPDIFIPIAEDCGLIVSIGHWVLLEACKQAKHWVDASLPALNIAVNISAMEFHKKNFVDGLRNILKSTELEAHYLELEITVSVLMSNAESSKSLLYELKDIGVRLAVDDFGTGYSSLSYLKQFPLDVLKIDKSFVKDIGAAGDSETIICAIISMGNSLKLKVIAEGVENAMQLEFLKSNLCEEGQGYLFSRPLSANDFATLLAKEPS